MYKLAVLAAVVSQTTYETDEEEEYVTVCVNISGADLARDITVSVSTQDITATGTTSRSG